MTLRLPPFKKLDERVTLSEFHDKNTLTLGEIRKATEGYSDDCVVWLGTGGKASDVRPSQHVVSATTYVLIS